MSPWLNTVYVLLVGLVISGIPMVFQAKAWKLEGEANKNKEKLELSEKTKQVAWGLIGGGAASLVIVALAMTFEVLH